MSSLLSPPSPREEEPMCILFRVVTGEKFLVNKKDLTLALKDWIEKGKASNVRLIGPFYFFKTCDWCYTTVESERYITVHGHGDFHISKTCPKCEPRVAEFLKGILGPLAHLPEIKGKEIPVKVQRTSGGIEIWVAGSLLPKMVTIAGAPVYCLQVFQFGVWQNEGMQKWVPVEDLVTLNFTQPDGTVHYDAEGKPVQNLDITFNPLLRRV